MCSLTLSLTLNPQHCTFYAHSGRRQRSFNRRGAVSEKATQTQHILSEVYSIHTSTSLNGSVALRTLNGELMSSKKAVSHIKTACTLSRQQLELNTPRRRTRQDKLPTLRRWVAHICTKEGRPLNRPGQSACSDFQNFRKHMNNSRINHKGKSEIGYHTSSNFALSW